MGEWKARVRHLDRMTMMVGLDRAKSPFEGSRLISSPSYMSNEDMLAWLMALAKSCFVLGFCNLDKITNRLHR